MKHKQEKLYEHYQRPAEPRVACYKSTSKSWIVTIVILLIVIVALVPVVHHLAANSKTGNQGNQAVELQHSQPKKQQKVKITAKKTKINGTHRQKISAKKRRKEVKQLKQYIVQDGDSLTSIAQKHHLDVSNLAQLNNLDVDSQIETGQTLRLK